MIVPTCEFIFSYGSRENSTLNTFCCVSYKPALIIVRSRGRLALREKVKFEKFLYLTFELFADIFVNVAKQKSHLIVHCYK